MLAVLRVWVNLQETVGFNMIYSVNSSCVTLPPASLQSCGKTEFGQISRSFSLNSCAIRLKRPKNLTQIGFPSRRSVKPDSLLRTNNSTPSERSISWFRN